jgi:hypothetical protein
MKAILLILALPVFPAAQSSAKVVPIILETDIGCDVDDVYALVLAARSPHVDLLVLQL